jgi:opacity protein-like surface antigen
MKKIALPIVVLGFFVIPSQTRAENTAYVRLGGGFALQNNSNIDAYREVIKYQKGNVIDVAAGLSEEELRIEAEILYRKNDIDSYFGLSMTNSSLSQRSFMINFLYDIDMDNAFSPLLMTGLGLTHATFDFNGNKYSSTRVTLQVGAGFGISVSDNITLDFSARHIKPINGKFFDSGRSISLAGNSIMTGIRYGF